MKFINFLLLFILCSFSPHILISMEIPLDEQHYRILSRSIQSWDSAQNCFVTLSIAHALDVESLEFFSRTNKKGIKTFKELMDLHDQEQLPFIVALVTTKPNDHDEVHCYDAYEFLRYQSPSANMYCNGHRFSLNKSQHAHQDPESTNTILDRIYFYALFKNKTIFLGSDYDLYRKQVFITLFLQANPTIEFINKIHLFKKLGLKARTKAQYQLGKAFSEMPESQENIELASQYLKLAACHSQKPKNKEKAEQLLTTLTQFQKEKK